MAIFMSVWIRFSSSGSVERLKQKDSKILCRCWVEGFRLCLEVRYVLLRWSVAKVGVE